MELSRVILVDRDPAFVLFRLAGTFGLLALAGCATVSAGPQVSVLERSSSGVRVQWSPDQASRDDARSLADAQCAPRLANLTSESARDDGTLVSTFRCGKGFVATSR